MFPLVVWRLVLFWLPNIYKRQLPWSLPQKSCSKKSHIILRKAPVPKSLVSLLLSYLLFICLFWFKYDWKSGYKLHYTYLEHSSLEKSTKQSKLSKWWENDWESINNKMKYYWNDSYYWVKTFLLQSFLKREKWTKLTNIKRSMQERFSFSSIGNQCLV